MWVLDDGAGVTPTGFDPGATGITAPEVAAYQTAQATPPGEQTAAEQAVVAAVEAKLSVISVDWNAIQQAVNSEVLIRAAQLQKSVTDIVRQYSLPRQSGPQSEMFSVVTNAMVERDRTLLELRERLDASPY